jgi:hypothetical protein
MGRQRPGVRIDAPQGAGYRPKYRSNPGWGMNRGNCVGEVSDKSDVVVRIIGATRRFGHRIRVIGDWDLVDIG